MEESLRQLVYSRKKWLFPTFFIGLLIYFCLPLSLIFIPDVMNKPSFFFNLLWAWVFALIQVPMTWLFCGIYDWKAKKYDQKLEEIKGENLE